MAMRIKPRQVKDGLLVYCAQTEEGQGNFSSLSIKDKRIEFRFDSGSGNTLAFFLIYCKSMTRFVLFFCYYCYYLGPAILRSEREIRAGEWVHVTADRSFRDGVLIVNDGSELRGKSPGSTRGLNLNSFISSDGPPFGIQLKP